MTVTFSQVQILRVPARDGTIRLAPGGIAVSAYDAATDEFILTRVTTESEEVEEGSAAQKALTRSIRAWSDATPEPKPAKPTK